MRMQYLPSQDDAKTLVRAFRDEIPPPPTMPPVRGNWHTLDEGAEFVMKRLRLCNSRAEQIQTLKARMTSAYDEGFRTGWREGGRNSLAALRSFVGGSLLSGGCIALWLWVGA